MRLSFYAASVPTVAYREKLKRAAREVFPGGVSLYPVSKPQGAVLLLEPSDTHEEMLEMFVYAKSLVPWPDHDEETLYFDIETHGAEKRWAMPPREFFRMGQYGWGLGGEVKITYDYSEMVDVCQSAYGLVAHNGHPFDFGVVLGDEALTWAREGRLFDTMVYGNLANPAPFMFTDRDGVKHYMEVAGQPKVVPHTMKWLALDNQAFQLGIPGKSESLTALAVRHNPPGTKKSELDYGLIPVDDPDFVAYGIQDVHVLRGVSHGLLNKRQMTDYDWREQLCAAINAQITRNGWRVDVQLAEARVAEQLKVKDRILSELHDKYDFPLEGKAPWSSSAGKKAILEALADHGIVPEQTPGWTMGKTGPSLSKEMLLENCKDTPAEELAVAITTLAGQRPLAGQALDFVQPDGRVHPDITALQRSGRMSVTKPSLGTWTARGPNAVEKVYFLADCDDHVIVDFDMSNADARAVAAMSRDEEFAKRFDGDIDSHELAGRLVFGDELYDSNPEFYRNKAKAGGHAWNYGAGWKRLMITLKITEEQAKAFVWFMEGNYRKVVAWQNRVRSEAEVGYAINAWGRRMKIDEGRAYTQAPALHGQSSTREALFDGLIKLPDEVLRMLKITIHDAVVFSFPKDRVDELSQLVVDCLEFEWNGIKFPLNRGPAAGNWYEANH